MKKIFVFLFILFFISFLNVFVSAMSNYEEIKYTPFSTLKIGNLKRTSNFLGKEEPLIFILFTKNKNLQGKNDKKKILDGLEGLNQFFSFLDVQTGLIEKSKGIFKEATRVKEKKGKIRLFTIAYRERKSLLSAEEDFVAPAKSFASWFNSQKFEGKVTIFTDGGATKAILSAFEDLNLDSLHSIIALNPTMRNSLITHGLKKIEKTGEKISKALEIGEEEEYEETKIEVDIEKLSKSVFYPGFGRYINKDIVDEFLNGFNQDFNKAKLNFISTSPVKFRTIWSIKNVKEDLINPVNLTVYFNYLMGRRDPKTFLKERAIFILGEINSINLLMDTLSHEEIGLCYTLDRYSEPSRGLLNYIFEILDLHQ